MRNIAVREDHRQVEEQQPHFQPTLPHPGHSGMEEQQPPIMEEAEEAEVIMEEAEVQITEEAEAEAAGQIP